MWENIPFKSILKLQYPKVRKLPIFGVHSTYDRPIFLGKPSTSEYDRPNLLGTPQYLTEMNHAQSTVALRTAVVAIFVVTPFSIHREH